MDSGENTDVISGETEKWQGIPNGEEYSFEIADLSISDMIHKAADTMESLSIVMEGQVRFETIYGEEFHRNFIVACDNDRVTSYISLRAFHLMNKSVTEKPKPLFMPFTPVNFGQQEQPVTARTKNDTKVPASNPESA